ncbi:MAG: prepilin peptidase [Bacillales bacterium]|jgi:leader peptidase (prepilin peptidase)/N-methyltransferase|nr:prepilin peptidase [Bacillales bacterium]
MIFFYLIVGIIFVFLASCYKEYYYKKGIKFTIKNPNLFFRENRITIFIYLGNSLGISFLQQNGNISFLASLEYLILLFTVWIMSEIDIKERIIPNFLILFLLASRLLFLCYANYQAKDFLKFLFYSPFVGFLIGGGVLFVSRILSRNGIGFGDVKMFAIIGFFVGENGIINVLFYTFFITAVVGVSFLLLKKMSLKDNLPLAPFAFLGLLLYFPLTFINW